LAVSASLWAKKVGDSELITGTVNSSLSSIIS